MKEELSEIEFRTTNIFLKSTFKKLVIRKENWQTSSKTDKGKKDRNYTN